MPTMILGLFLGGGGREVGAGDQGEGDDVVVFGVVVLLLAEGAERLNFRLESPRVKYCSVREERLFPTVWA